MKLYKINRKDTRQWVTSTHWIPVDPTTLELAAVRVLEKVKEYLEGAVDMHLVGVRNLIRNLESDVSKSEPQQGEEK